MAVKTLVPRNTRTRTRQGVETRVSWAAIVAVLLTLAGFLAALAAFVFGTPDNTVAFALVVGSCWSAAVVFAILSVGDDGF